MNECESCKNKADELLPGHFCNGVRVGHECGCHGHHSCGCPEPIQEVSQPYSSAPGILRWNYGGRSVDYDLTNLVRMTQTDTSLSTNTQDRTLVYSAERHTDELSAKELGAILHVEDLGNVDIDNIDDGSLLVYQKDTTCADGCTGINNVWKGWKAYDQNALETSLNSIMGFDTAGRLHSLNTPTHTTQYWNLGWNANGKLGYTQPTEASLSSLHDTNNKVYRLYLDPTTKRIVFVKENP